VETSVIKCQGSGISRFMKVRKIKSVTFMSIIDKSTNLANKFLERQCRL